MSDAPIPPASPDDFADPPAWPKVVGITSIVFGALGLLCTGCGGAMLVAQPFFLKMAEEQYGPAPDVLKPAPAQVLLLPFSLGLALMLLIAGVMLVRRRPVARPLHLAYAVLNILSTVVGIFFGLQHLEKLRDWVAANPGDQWAQMVNVPQQVATLVIIAVLGMAWPLFCLVWFGLVKRKASDMGQAREVL